MNKITNNEENKLEYLPREWRNKVVTPYSKNTLEDRKRTISKHNRKVYFRVSDAITLGLMNVKRKTPKKETIKLCLWN